jgi:hypothetical protein
MKFSARERAAAGRPAESRCEWNVEEPAQTIS